MDSEEEFALWNWLWGQTGAKSWLTSLRGFRAFEGCRIKSRLRPLDQSQGLDTPAHACVRGLNELKEKACGESSRSTSVHLCISHYGSEWGRKSKWGKNALSEKVVWITNGGFIPFSPFFPLQRHACHSIMISQPPVHVCQIQLELSACLQLWSEK